MSTVYETVTERIIADLEQGVAPWVKPWKSGAGIELPRNAISQRAYSGVNVLLLWGESIDRGYRHPTWLTFKQAQDHGGYVRKGEHGVQIVYTSNMHRKEHDNETGEDREWDFSFLKFYTVFNVAQVEGLPAHVYYIPEPKLPGTVISEAEEFIAALKAKVVYVGERAAYIPSLDLIRLPPRELFESMPHFYSTSLHEHSHWSGAQSRLGRNLSGRFGDQAYAAEELVAELCAAFLCAHLGIEGSLRHAEYIGSWLALLRHDKRAIFTAAARATEAAEFLRKKSEAGRMN